MLEITIKGREFWDSEKEEFVYTNDLTLHLEHSLLSLAKWESKYKRPFLSDGPKTKKENIDYIMYMSLNKINDLTSLEAITESDLKTITDYINDPMTATTFTDRSKGQKKSNSRITNEEIYYYMTALNIPFSCEKWHLNRLLTLIEVASIKNTPPKKMSKNDILRQNHALNAARRAKSGSRG